MGRPLLTGLRVRGATWRWETVRGLHPLVIADNCALSTQTYQTGPRVCTRCCMFTHGLPLVADPFSSSYLMHGKSLLPPWPMRLACSVMNDARSNDELFVALRRAVSIYYNSTRDVPCYNITGNGQRSGPEHRRRMGSPIGAPLTDEQLDSENSCQGNWGYQWCDACSFSLVGRV